MQIRAKNFTFEILPLGGPVTSGAYIARPLLSAWFGMKEVRAFGVENISEVRSIVDVSNVKRKFSLRGSITVGEDFKEAKGYSALIDRI